MKFNPEGTFTTDSSIFGMPKNTESKVHLIPAPWEPTTSFKKGTAKGPKALFEASKQMDLYHPYFKKSYEQGVYWEDADLIKITELNNLAAPLCASVREQLESGFSPDSSRLDKVNSLSNEFNEIIYTRTKQIIDKNKVAAIVGGDHSTPFGLIKALSEKYKDNLSIIHIDAHFDLRDSYQGFTHSHASIMYNVLKLENPPEIYQLGIRDFSESEYNLAEQENLFFLDQEIHKKLLSGQSFSNCLDELFKSLKENIYISFDIDGLSPEFCPNTGTPVPGGLSYNQAVFMIQQLHAKGHKLVGFDLVEVSPGDSAPLGEGLDETIGVRVLYELCCFANSSL